MVLHLNVIGQTSSDVPLVKSTDMGQLFLQLDENFRSLAEDSQIAQSLMSSSELKQKLKSGVQNLGMSCIELVKLGNRRRNYPNDQVNFSSLTNVYLFSEFHSSYHSKRQSLRSVFVKYLLFFRKVREGHKHALMLHKQFLVLLVI